MFPDNDIYKTIKLPSEGLFKDRGSRFIALANPVKDISGIKELLENYRKKYHDARHHCYAYVVGYDKLTWRANDDGEPSGTAGKPILGQINSHDLTNILIVVVRYFGGTLLGTSGLINAYRTAASEAIKNATIIESIIRNYYRLNFPYPSMNDVMKLLKDENIIQSHQQFGLDCSVVIGIRSSSTNGFIEKVQKIEGIETSFLETR
ncbi:MAG: YigZ family protein [Bacteroidales bacterium]